MNPGFERRDFLKLMGTAASTSLVSARTSPSRQEPFFWQKDIFIGGLDGVSEYRIPALVTTRQGTLLALCDARVERPGDAPNNIDLALKRSRDNGATWERVKIVVDFPGDQAACDPCMLLDRQSGSVWILYDHIWPTLEAMEEANRTLPPGIEPDASGRIILLHAIVSHDQGQTWSRPRDITEMVTQPIRTKVMAAPGMGIQMRNGRLLAPCYSDRRKEGKLTGSGYSSLCYSDDRGKTWHLGGAAAESTNECQVVELVDGSLMLNMRNFRKGKEGRRAVATSGDGGASWSGVQYEDTLIEPNCQASFIRYTDTRQGAARNRLLFSNPAHGEKRVNMTVRLSRDEAQTWPTSKVIYPGPSAYSCLTVLADGSIGMLYENGLKTPYEKIIFARFNLEWLTDGRDSLAS